MTTALIAIAMFCGLIFVHELGHFLAAKAVGVPVIEFSIGMGTPIVQRKKGETEYSLRLFPIGGYCKMEGEDEESENERAFNRQPAWARILIIISGSFMNVVAAIVILAVVHTQAGAYTNVLGTVTESFPAYEAGLLAGDEIIAVNGESVREWVDIVNAITNTKEDRIPLTVLRDGIEQTLYSGVLINEEGRRVIGITPEVSHSLLLGTRDAFRSTAALLSEMGHFLVRLVSGGASASDVAGPIGIVSIIGQQAKYGWLSVLYLAAMISLNLAVVNMLPLPALDGGRLLFIVVRSLGGGRISDESEALIHTIGMVFLMGLMVFMLFKDAFQFLL